MCFCYHLWTPQNVALMILTRSQKIVPARLEICEKFVKSATEKTMLTYCAVFGVESVVAKPANQACLSDAGVADHQKSNDMITLFSHRRASLHRRITQIPDCMAAAHYIYQLLTH